MRQEWHGKRVVRIVGEGHLKGDLKSKKSLPWEYPRAKYSLQLRTQRWECICACLKDRKPGWLEWGREWRKRNRRGAGSWKSLLAMVQRSDLINILSSCLESFCFCDVLKFVSYHTYWYRDVIGTVSKTFQQTMIYKEGLGLPWQSSG